MVIYKITNRINGKVYIGQTTQAGKRRWYEHRAAAKNGGRQHLYVSMRKYGIDAFDWEIIDQADNLATLNQLETKWVAHYRSITECYNHRNGGDNSLHSEASIEKMRESQKAAHARRRAENGGIETINKCSGYKFSKPHPKKGKPSKKWSEEAKARFSLLCKQRKQSKNFTKEQQ